MLAAAAVRPRRLRCRRSGRAPISPITPSHPPEALRNREGSVRFAVDVGANGRVRACRVIASRRLARPRRGDLLDHGGPRRFSPARDVQVAPPDRFVARSSGRCRWKRQSRRRMRARANLASYVTDRLSDGRPTPQRAGQGRLRSRRVGSEGRDPLPRHRVERQRGAGPHGLPDHAIERALRSGRDDQGNPVPDRISSSIIGG